MHVMTSGKNQFKAVSLIILSLKYLKDNQKHKLLTIEQEYLHTFDRISSVILLTLKTRSICKTMQKWKNIY